MRSFVVAAAVLACACGDVLKVPDAHVIDAYQPDSPPNPMCAANETMVCNGACVDPMTSEQYCGNCTTQCNPTQGCIGGTCLPNFTDCKRVKDTDPMAADGQYTNPNNGNFFFCDFTNNVQIDEFRFDRFDVAPTGFTVVRAADLTGIIGKAFVGYYNRDHGIRAQTTFSIGNCCITTIAGNRLKTGPAGSELPTFPALGSGMVTCTFSMAANTVYTISRTQSNGFYDQLPVDFFTTFPPSEGAGCAESTNPAIYVKTHPIN